MFCGSILHMDDRVTISTCALLNLFPDEATFRLNDANVKVHILSRLEAFITLTFWFWITYKKLFSNPCL